MVREAVHPGWVEFGKESSMEPLCKGAPKVSVWDGAKFVPVPPGHVPSGAHP